MVQKKTLHDINPKNKHVLIRVDFNVPIIDGEVGDDTRILSALPTIKYLLKEQAAIILCSHLGRPNGEPNPKYSLRPVGDHLANLLKMPIAFAENCIGAEAVNATQSLKPGQILLLENTRFHAGETKNNPEMAKKLAALADIFVNDAFGSVHRAHASTVGVASLIPSVAGLSLEEEIKYLKNTLGNPDKPFVTILGGAKISDKIGVIQNLLKKADTIMIGGGMANTFFKSQGYPIGDSLVEDQALNTARDLVINAGSKLRLPIDLVIADKFEPNATSKTIPSGPIPNGWRILDIGPETVAQYMKVIQNAKTVVWNGPMGVFEFPAFSKGTVGIAQAVAESEALTIVGGGESVAAVKQSGLTEKISHISTGGGAFLKVLEGSTLPGVAALQDL